ncbi:chitin binding peritrophin-A domain-containing protein [Phthorimaea operculella]|nr:chitin binding peritrophin-A domain-containing protein [Phthorimaea operculella]
MESSNRGQVTPWRWPLLVSVIFLNVTIPSLVHSYGIFLLSSVSLGVPVWLTLTTPAIFILTHGLTLLAEAKNHDTFSFGCVIAGFGYGAITSCWETAVQEFVGARKWPKLHSTLETLSVSLLAGIILGLSFVIKQASDLQFCMFIVGRNVAMAYDKKINDMKILFVTGPQYATNQGIYEQTTLQTVPKIDNKGTTKSLATSKTGFETAQTEDLRPSFQSTAPDMPVVQATSQQDLIATRGPSTQDLTASQATQGASDLTAAKDTQDLTEAQATQGSSDLNATHATQDPTTAQATQGSSDLNAAHATQDFIAAQATQSSSDLNAAHATQDLTASQATQGASDLTATQGTSDLTAAQGASDLTAAQATQGASDLTATQSASDLTVTQAIQGASDLTAVQVTQGASDLTATQSASDLTVTQATQGASDLTAAQATQGASDLTAAQATQGASDLTAAQATQGASDLTAAQATQSASHLTVTQGTTNLNAAQGASDLPVTQGASYLTAAQATQGASDLTVAQGASDLTAAQATPGASDLTAARGASDLTAAQTTQSASNVIVAQAAITDLITTQTLPQQGVTEQNKPEFTSEQSNIETTGLQATSQLAIAQKTEPSQQSHIGTIPGPQTVHSVQNVNETQSKQSTTQQDGTKNEHRNQSVPTATATQANHKLPQVIAPAESHSTTANKNIAVSKGHNIPEKVDSLINIITSPGLLTNSSGNTLKTDEENTILSSTQLSISKQNVSQTKPEHSKTNISQGGITNSDSDKYNEFLQNHVTVQTGSPVNADSVAINTIQREKNNSLTNIPSSVLHIQNGTVTISQEHQDSTSVLSSTKSVISDDWLVFKTTVSPSSNSENARTLEYTKLTSGNPKDIEITDRDINQMPKSNNDITTVSTSTSQDNVPIVTLMDSSNTVTSATITGKDVLFTNSALSANANTETVTEALFYDNKDYNIVPITTLNTVTNQKNSYASDNNKVIQDQIQNGVLSTTTPALIYNIRSPDITPTLPAMYTTKMPFNSYVPILTTTTKYTDKEETTVTTTTEGSTTSSTTINNLNVPQFECEGRPSGRYADNDDCSKFYICSGTSQTIVGSCPVNTVFSDIKKQCTRNLSHCIRNNEFKCTAAGRFADYLKPNVYYICITKDDSFLRYKLQCQNGYLLNRLTVTCYNNFEKPSSQSSSTTTTTSRTTTVKLPQENKVKRTRKEKEVDDFECEEEGKFADPNNCRGYYICKLKNRSEETYRRKYRKCDSDEVFHREKKRCVDADSSYECRYCDALTPNVYYIQIMKGDHFITYKLACRKDYHLNKKKVMCERFLQSEKKPESPEPSQPKEISKKSSEDVSEKEYDSDRSERQDSFECEEEGKFTDPNDCRRSTHNLIIERFY